MPEWQRVPKIYIYIWMEDMANFRFAIILVNHFFVMVEMVIYTSTIFKYHIAIIQPI